MITFSTRSEAIQAATDFKARLQSEDYAFITALGIAAEAAKVGLYLGPAKAMSAPPNLRISHRSLLYSTSEGLMEDSEIGFDLFEFEK